MSKAVANREIPLRKTPSVNTKIIDIIPEGESVNVLEQVENWSKVDYNDQEGYVSTAELNFGGSPRVPQPKLETKDIEVQAEVIIEANEESEEVSEEESSDEESEEESDLEETPRPRSKRRKK